MLPDPGGMLGHDIDVDAPEVAVYLGLFTAWLRVPREHRDRLPVAEWRREALAELCANGPYLISAWRPSP